MKLSAVTKKEIAADPEGRCCRQAMLSAIIHTGGTVSLSNKGIRIFVSGSDSVTGAVRDLFYLLFGENICIKADKAVIDGDSDKVRGVMTFLKIFKSNGEIESGIGTDIAITACCKRAYLAGSFLGCGSITLPKNGGYSLEFLCESVILRDDIKKLFEQFEIAAGTAEKAEKYKLYIKDRQALSDSLALMGANKAVLQLNALIAERELKQSTARQANCDLANLDRTVEVSVRQCKAVEWLKKNGALKDIKLVQVASVRLQHPEASYEELAKIIGISKSAVKYRLGKIVALWEVMQKNFSI